MKVHFFSEETRKWWTLAAVSFVPVRPHDPQEREPIPEAMPEAVA